MKILIFFTICLLPLKLGAQSLFNERFSPCDANTFVVEKDSMLALYQPKEALLLDILKKLETRNLKKIKGELLLQIMVDPSGHPCCVSLTNQTNITTKRLNIVNAVNTTTGWKIGQPADAKPFNICTIVKFIFTDDKFIAMRLGLTSRSRFIVLSTTELKRNAKY